MNGHGSRKDWMKSYVRRLVRDALADMVLTHPHHGLREAAKLVYENNLEVNVAESITDYANLRELQDIIDWNDRRKNT